MNVATLFGLCAAGLVGVGLYGLIVQPHPLRKIIAFNVMGSGVFILFGAVAKRGAAAGFGGDPVPQALLITAIVVAFSATALAVALLVRLIDATGSASLSADPPPEGTGAAPAADSRPAPVDSPPARPTVARAKPAPRGAERDG